MTLENLQFTGGRGGVLFIGSRVQNQITNCLTQNNGVVGLFATDSDVRIDDTTFNEDVIGVIVDEAGFVRCANCTLTGTDPDQGIGLIADQASVGVLRDSTISNIRNGVRCNNGARCDLRDTSITATRDSLNAVSNAATITVRRGTLDGSLNFAGARLFLNGVEQTGLGLEPDGITPRRNNFRNDSYLFTNCDDCGGPAPIFTTLLDVGLDGFSNAVLTNSSLEAIACTRGADAVCEGAVPTNSGSTDCASCP